jgi:hypothetical protein
VLDGQLLAESSGKGSFLLGGETHLFSSFIENPQANGKDPFGSVIGLSLFLGLGSLRNVFFSIQSREGLDQNLGNRFENTAI